MNPLLYGYDESPGLIALQLSPGGDEMRLTVRRGEETVVETEAFEPFIVAAESVCPECPVACEVTPLDGQGELDRLLTFGTWADCLKGKDWLAKSSGAAPSSPKAKYFILNDPVQQHLVRTGRTSFLGMQFEDLRRMQIDIECITTEGYEFCNPEREGDRIVAIAFSDSSGWVEVLSGVELDEKSMLQRMVEIVRARDPDVIEGHNIFNFDLRYIFARARRHRVKMALGRDGSVPRVRPSRMSVGERTMSYDRCEIVGRHVVDTLHLVHAYDITHRSLGGYGLKEVAVHFGLAAADRTYIEGSQISATWRTDPARVMRYVTDDVTETRGLSNLLSQSGFLQAQMLPFNYQNVCVRGNATKIDALLVREYLRRRHALPCPDMVRQFAGGYTDMFVEGVVTNVHHCDVRSLYPSLMITRELVPRHDELGVFVSLLADLRTFRLEAKGKMGAAKTAAERNHYDALQTTFKVLINSFYGYLGFSQARFSDFDRAEQVTADGRALLREMIDWLNKHGARPVEIDTDGIYFVPPAAETQTQREEFRAAFAASLPAGIEVEFDGEYKAMYSYKMKNYALLTHAGEMIVKGAALKSRGLEPFQRDFLRESIRLRLVDDEAAIGVLRAEYAKAIVNREWPIERFAKTEMLQDAPSTYAAKRDTGKRARSAAYELALQSGRDYQAGDQVSYYVTGSKKSVAVHEAARLVSEWEPQTRDENVPYYLAKLEALHKKFGGVDRQPELAL